jgi:hypothetical protein
MHITLIAAAAAAALGGGQGPQPVPVDTSVRSPVTVEVDVVGPSRAVVERLACSWEYAPEEDDHACLAFQGDPQRAIAAIREAGGVRAVKHVTAPTKGIDTTTRISRRADGTWVFRTTGTVDGRPWRYVRTYDPGR